jgi:hypothetical protein
MKFDDLPCVESYDDVRRVHNTAGLFLLNKSRLTAHTAPFDCSEVAQVEVINKPAWRIATDAQVRDLGGGWCTNCS